MVSISTSGSSPVSFERASHTWTKFIQIQSAVQPMKMERIVGLTQVFLKRRDWTASVGRKAATGWDKWLVAVCGGRRASMKFSSFHMMSISTSCSSHVSFERSSHANPNSFANKQMKCELCEMLNIKRCYGNKFESLNAYCVRLYALFLRTIAYLRLGSFESGCMHNPRKSIPAPRCLKSWTC